jgi:hypothetical protein
MRLDAFGDDLTARRRGEVDETRDDGLAGHILIDAPDETYVDLDEVRPEFHEVVEIRDPSAGVVDGESNVGAQTEDCLAQWGVLGDGVMFGDLQNHRSAPRGQHVAQRRTGGDERRRHIEAEPCPNRQKASGLERGVERHRLKLNT